MRIINRNDWLRNKALECIQYAESDARHFWAMPTHLVEGYNLKTKKLLEREIYLLDIELGWGVEVRKKYEEIEVIEPQQLIAQLYNFPGV